MGSEIDAPKLENSSTVVGHPLRHPPKHPVENLVAEVNRFSIALPVGTIHTMNNLAASNGESDPEEIDLPLLPRLR